MNWSNRLLCYSAPPRALRAANKLIFLSSVDNPLLRSTYCSVPLLSTLPLLCSCSEPPSPSYCNVARHSDPRPASFLRVPRADSQRSWPSQTGECAGTLARVGRSRSASRRTGRMVRRGGFASDRWARVDGSKGLSHIHARQSPSDDRYRQLSSCDSESSFQWQAAAASWSHVQRASLPCTDFLPQPRRRRRRTMIR